MDNYLTLKQYLILFSKAHETYLETRISNLPDNKRHLVDLASESSNFAEIFYIIAKHLEETSIKEKINYPIDTNVTTNGYNYPPITTTTNPYHVSVSTQEEQRNLEETYKNSKKHKKDKKDKRKWRKKK